MREPDYFFFCDNCVCRHCYPVRCPYGNNGRTMSRFCSRSREGGFCPRLFCSFFVNRYIIMDYDSY